MMDLYLFRHGIAFDREDPDCPPDRQRPLTELGFRRTRQAAEGCKRLGIAPELLVSSPYLRTVQTAEILAEVFVIARESIVQTEDLEPDSDPRRILGRLGEFDAESVICIGHGPQLDLLLAALIGAPGDLRLRLGKAGAAHIKIDGDRPGEGRLRWLLRPKILRRLSASSGDE